MQSKREMRSKMKAWFKEFSGTIDPRTGLTLFTIDTKPMFLQYLEKCSSIIDGLDKDESYEEILPKKR